MTNSEVERYTFRTPAQATSYFYGFTRLLELRADTEKVLGANFNQQAYHDFILSQGLLPPALLRKAVMEEFVKNAPNPVAKELSLDELKTILEAKNPQIVFLDVREPKELQELGTIEGYVNIPVTELEARLNELPKDKLIITA
jgi:hypothetical protein